MLRRNNGLSIVELLITLLLSSVLLAMAIGLYVTSVSSGAKSLKYSRLRADLQSIVSLMETDIRRAGYGGRDFMVGAGGNKTIDSINSTPKDCIVYYYNHNAGSVIDSANKMGFRFNADKKEIQFGTGVDPLAANCYSAGIWKALSDKAFITITSLNFTEKVESNASATMRSVLIEISGELAADSSVKHSVRSLVQVRNVEFH